MSEVVALFAFDTNAETSCLSIAEGRAGTHLKILLLSGTPSLYVAAFYFEVSKVARAALECSYGDIERAEEVNGILPEFVIPGHAVFGFADNDHFLLFKLVDTVNASLLDAVSADLLTEAGAVAGEGLGQLVLGSNSVDELTDQK